MDIFLPGYSCDRQLATACQDLADIVNDGGIEIKKEKINSTKYRVDKETVVFVETCKHLGVTFSNNLN